MRSTLIIILVVLVGGAGAAYFYFKGSDKHLQLIPKDATMVGTIDYLSMASKADVNKIQTLTFYKDMEAKAKNEKDNADAQKWMDVLKNPFSSGINLASDIYFFVANENNKPLFACDVDIKNENQFRTTLKKFVSDKDVTSEKKYRAVYNDNWALAWNDMGLLFVMVEGDDGKETEKKFFDESFSREKSASILDNKFFREFETTKKDMGLFINAGEYAKTMDKLSSSYSSGNPLSPAMENTWKDSYCVINTTFEDGRVHTTFNLKSDNKDIDKVNLFRDKGLSPDMLNDITTKDVYALMSFSINPQKLLALLDQVPSWKDAKEDFAKSQGVEVKDLDNIFGGDFASSLNDFVELQPDKLDPAMYEYYMKAYGSIPSYMQPHDKFPQALFSINISSNNKEAVKKMLDKQIADGRLTKRPDNIYSLSMDADYTFYLVENKTGFTYTDDSTLAKNISTNNSLVPLKKDLNDVSLNYPVAFYFNLDFNNYPLSLRNYLLKTMGESYYNPIMTYAKVLKDYRSYGRFTDGEFNLNLSDGQGNSLYRLIAQFDEAYKIAHKPSPM